MLIGLTGGIASGKSTVARRLAEHGAVIIDADQLAREAVEPGSIGLESVREAFGSSVIAPDGSLDRAALGQRVFGDDKARQRLEAIVHPIVRSLSEQRIAAARAENPRAVVVYDVPLLVEAARELPFDLVVVVVAGEQVQLERLTAIRGLSSDAARARLTAQVSDAERIVVSDVVIDSSGTLAHTVAQVDALWVDRIAPVR